MHSNWGFEQMPNFFFPFPITFFSPPNNHQAGLQLCAEPLAIFQAPWLFLLSLGLPEFDSSPTLVVDWWCQLRGDSTTSSQFFSRCFLLWFLKIPLWAIQKAVSLKGTSSLALSDFISPCLQTTSGWGSCSSYPAHWLKLIPKFPTTSECTAFSNSVIAYTDMLKAQTDAGILEHGFGEFLCSDNASFCYLPNKVTVFSLWSILFK